MTNLYWIDEAHLYKFLAEHEMTYEEYEKRRAEIEALGLEAALQRIISPPSSWKRIRGRRFPVLPRPCYVIPCPGREDRWRPRPLRVDGHAYHRRCRARTRRNR